MFCYILPSEGDTIKEKRNGLYKNRLLSYSFTNSPLLPNGNYSYRKIKISFSKKEGIKKEIYYERRVYESVDDESLS